MLVLRTLVRQPGVGGEEGGSLPERGGTDSSVCPLTTQAAHWHCPGTSQTWRPSPTQIRGIRRDQSVLKPPQMISSSSRIENHRVRHSASTLSAGFCSVAVGAGMLTHFVCTMVMVTESADLRAAVRMCIKLGTWLSPSRRLYCQLTAAVLCTWALDLASSELDLQGHLHLESPGDTGLWGRCCVSGI